MKRFDYLFRFSKDPSATAAKMRPAALSAWVRTTPRGTASVRAFGSRPHSGGDLFHFPHQIFGVGSGQPGGRGTFFIFAANFYPIAREGSPAGERIKNFLPRKTSHAPAVGLSDPDMSFCYTRTPPTARSKNVCRARQRQIAANVTVNTGGWSVFVTPRREASSYLISLSDRIDEWRSRRFAFVPIEIAHFAAGWDSRNVKMQSG